MWSLKNEINDVCSRMLHLWQIIKEYFFTGQLNKMMKLFHSQAACLAVFE